MDRITCLMLLTLFLGTLLSFAQNKHDIQNINSHNNTHFLNFRGRIVQGKAREPGFMKKIDSAKITVINENDKVFGVCYTNKIGIWNTNLPLNHNYVIKISKTGWLTKTLKVNTNIPSEEIKNQSFFFDLYFFEDIPALNVSILKKSIADVYYNKSLKIFYYNYRYTDMVYKYLRKMYYDYYSSHTLDSRNH